MEEKTTDALSGQKSASGIVKCCPPGPRYARSAVNSFGSALAVFGSKSPKEKLMVSFVFELSFADVIDQVMVVEQPAPSKVV